ncbi:WD repeat-containing protein 25 isoform X2 [Anomaloglossus baeobatrachus]|uniref:WD repeat-containing protein 25 isoform X2 n=1 Tax=Anomaloglossus baeobatrachus TaxID=238106 RepID=UPI003F508E6E
MNSLVAYDDSDSETEDDRRHHTTQVTDAPPMHVLQHQPQSDASLHSTSLAAPFGSSSCGTDFTLTDQYPAQSANYNPTYKRGLSNSAMKASILSYQKRPQASGGVVVKPYVPKRRKLEQSNMAAEVESDEPTGSHDHISHSARNIYRVSEYLGPHLSLKYSSSGIPKKLIFQMKEHAGPVNRVQWCPVKPSSHLLLSASMDGTCKVWDAVDSGKSLCTISCHRAAVRDAQWSLCGKKILTGGFDCFLHLTDVETGEDLFTAKNDCKISAVRFHPRDPNMFICGGFSPVITAYDIRMSKMIHEYRAAVQQHFDILFLHDGREFLSTTDCVSQDSADRTIIAWDFTTTAKVSNQIFHERYTCPSLALHPKESVFAAQTNGNYIALFSTQRPYKMNKKKRFEGHKVEGFAVGCEFSPDGSIIVTGSSEGNVIFYNYQTSKIIQTLPSHGSPCVSVQYHSVLPSLLATCYWDGEIRIWE